MIGSQEAGFLSECNDLKHYVQVQIKLNPEACICTVFHLGAEGGLGLLPFMNRLVHRPCEILEDPVTASKSSQHFLEFKQSIPHASDHVVGVS